MAPNIQLHRYLALNDPEGKKINFFLSFLLLNIIHHKQDMNVIYAHFIFRYTHFYVPFRKSIRTVCNRSSVKLFPICRNRLVHIQFKELRRFYKFIFACREDGPWSFFCFTGIEKILKK